MVNGKLPDFDFEPREGDPCDYRYCEETLVGGEDVYGWKDFRSLETLYFHHKNCRKWERRLRNAGIAIVSSYIDD